MAEDLSRDAVVKALTAVFDEVFEHHHGIFIDKGTTLFESIGTLSAAEASRSASPRSASIAAHVDHLRFYMDVLEAHMTGKDAGTVDWQAIWRDTRDVSPERWDEIRAKLRASLQRVRALMADPEAWSRDTQFEGVLAISVHTAYHLGAIRQIIRSI